LTTIGAALAVLAVHNLGVERLPAALYVPACLGTASALVGLAYGVGIGPGALGFSTAGFGVGLAAGAVVVVLVVVAALLPRSRLLFADRRMAGVGAWGTAYRALVRIPLGTVAVEEVAFRGVLVTLLERVVPLGWAFAGSSLAFGLWHVVPVAATLRTNQLPVRRTVVGAAVIATGLVGAALCGLRLATGGLAAPMIVHASASAAATVGAAAVLRPTPRPAMNRSGRLDG
jgi:membrane protease YdiL (CAAX protease family)